MKKPKLKTLPNGLRVLLVNKDDSLTTTALVLVAAGCEHEKDHEYGIAHFLEHMCFKGTEKRPTPLSITRELEGLGAETNAFTSRRYTGYYAKAQKKHTKKILDVVADVYLNSTLPEGEIEKEKGVIVEEINMREDTPQILADRYFDEILFGVDTPEGHQILGTKESVRSFTRDDFVAFRERNYHADTTVVVIAGSFDEKEVLKMVEERFGEVSKGVEHKNHKPKFTPGPHIAHKKRDSEQTHIVLGVPAFGKNHKDLPTLGVLAMILGGGMSSRLFHKLREELGACYYVYASPNIFDHYGSFTIHAGIPNDRVEEVVGVLNEELQRIGREEVTDEEFRVGRNYREGLMIMNLESAEDLGHYYGSQVVSNLPLTTPKEKLKEMNAVTKKQVQKLAKKLFHPDRFVLAYVGPSQNTKRLKQLLR